MTLAAAPAGFGAISCAITIPAASSGKRIIYATHKVADGLPVGTLQIFDAGVDAATPYTISGLEAGAMYAVYVMLADAELAAAAAISASLVATVIAGA